MDVIFPFIEVKSISSFLQVCCQHTHSRADKPDFAHPVSFSAILVGNGNSAPT